MKRALGIVLKFAVTIAILVAIFLEFGGGYRAVTTASLSEPGAFEAANPRYPGIVGRLRARLTGTPLPAPRLPVSLAAVCDAAVERTVFVHLADGRVAPFKPLRHCGEGG